MVLRCAQESGIDSRIGRMLLERGSGGSAGDVSDLAGSMSRRPPDVRIAGVQSHRMVRVRSDQPRQENLMTPEDRAGLRAQLRTMLNDTTRMDRAGLVEDLVHTIYTYAKIHAPSGQGLDGREAPERDGLAEVLTAAGSHLRATSAVWMEEQRDRS